MGFRAMMASPIEVSPVVPGNVTLDTCTEYFDPTTRLTYVFTSAVDHPTGHCAGESGGSMDKRVTEAVCSHSGVGLRGVCWRGWVEVAVRVWICMCAGVSQGDL